MRSKGTILTLGAYLLVWTAGGCGPDRTRVGGNGNSETHFLESCTDTCPGDLACVCGVCTKPCSETADCRALASNAECASTCSVASEQQTCDVPCDRASDCSGLGASYACLSGRCRAPAAAGSAGASSSGGRAGAGGAGRAGGGSGAGGRDPRGTGGSDAAGAAGEVGGVANGAGGAGVEGGAAAGGAAGSDAAGSGGSAGMGATVVKDVASFHLAEFQAVCQGVFECADDSEDAILFTSMLQTQARCVDVLAGSPLYLAAERDLDQKVHDGSIELLLEQVPPCLDALRACPSASDGGFDGPACRAVFRGSSPLDGACSRSEDCASGARCVIDAECPGHCSRRAAIDEPCASTSDCDDAVGPVVCGSGSTCTPVSFQPASGADGPCTPTGSDGPEVTPCAAGLYCQPTDGTATTGTCRAAVAKDGDCTQIQRCSSGQVCLFSDTAEQAEGSCRTATFTDQPGAACDELGAFCDTAARLTCIDGTCQAVGDGSEGAPCMPIDYAALVQCDAGLVCLGPDPATETAGPGGYYWGTCGKPRASGERCSGNDDCASQHCRDDDTCGDAYCCGQYSCQDN